MNSLGLYIHIPFCSRKCGYCDFPSFEGRMGQRAPYVGTLLEEMATQSQAMGRPQVDTVYIGGGTPSLLTPGQVSAILAGVHQWFDLTRDCEITCEANPGALTPVFLQALEAGGVNRLSLGAQSADAGLLANLGRQHGWQEVAEAVHTARNAGFENLNIDLMLGIPGQTLALWEDTLEAALTLQPQHLSCYGLIVEEGTTLQARLQEGALTLPEPEEERAMYDHTLKRLQQAGFEQYEISNFSLPGRMSRHNVNCWRRMDYLGLGSGAHSLLNNQRRQNPAGLNDYLSGLAPEITQVTPEEAMFESVMLGLRMTQGVDLRLFHRLHGQDFRKIYQEQVKPSLGAGLTEWAGEFFRLTRRGMDVMNTVLLDFM